MAAAAPFDLKQHRKRAERAWGEKNIWQGLYDQAYEYAIPYRQPTRRRGQAVNRIDNLFDDTAITSTFHGAGTLKEDLFPSGQGWFKYEPGPVAKLAAKMDAENGAKFAADIEAVSDQIVPFFQTGEFDQAANEACIDLYAGTGAILPLDGDDENPVDFVAIPTEELATEWAKNKLLAGYWRTEETRRSIKFQFPKGKFPEEFERALAADGADELVEINQDFVRVGKRWKLIVTLKESTEPVVTETYRTQPIVIARYHKVPGENWGRGPIMLTLPAIKTSNKAQELVLKAFAIQMLGIWGYRPGGAFNPDTARLAPGAMWPMNSTGGVMGPDVQRLDPATGRVDMGQLVTQNLTDRIRTGLHDDRVESKGKTPVSASEFVGSLQRMKDNYIGAFGRLVHEIIPPLVRRVSEILYRKGLLQTDLKPDQLFVQVRILSPLADAMRISHLDPFLKFLQLLEALGQDPNRFIDLDQAIDDLMTELNIRSKWRRTAQQRAEIDQANAQKQAGAAVTEALVRKPEIVADAMKPQATEAAA
ncbi:hypothetical protein BA190_26860 [Labrys sp. WJW]|uniref:portal protein n=1 Tax=Labrys sp. WJW TaxID=1737983 RepID=UPI00082D9DEA|nr:portal protein [Labrys sp. WJW]OCC01836.1 hypothetical protein BA190_26860 [Labrys sp. WJW]